MYVGLKRIWAFDEDRARDRPFGQELLRLQETERATGAGVREQEKHSEEVIKEEFILLFTDNIFKLYLSV